MPGIISPEPFTSEHSESKTNQVTSVSVYQNGTRIRHFYNVKSLDSYHDDRVRFIDENGDYQTILNTNGIIIIEKHSVAEDIVVDAK